MLACLPRPLLTCSAVTTVSAPRCIRTPPPIWGEGRPASRHPRYSRPDRMASSATQTRQLSPLSALPISYTCVACANAARPMPGRYRSGNLGGRTACAAVERAAARRRGEPAAGAGEGAVGIDGRSAAEVQSAAPPLQIMRRPLLCTYVVFLFLRLWERFLGLVFPTEKAHLWHTYGVNVIATRGKQGNFGGKASSRNKKTSPRNLFSIRTFSRAAQIRPEKQFFVSRGGTCHVSHR